jgi:hypothetical protein
MYRPQFAYPTPDGYTDIDFEHYYDATTNPLLAPGAGYPDQIDNIPLLIDPDAPFHWRGIKIPNLDGANGPRNVGLRFRGPDGRHLSGPELSPGGGTLLSFVPIWLWGSTPNNGDALTGGQCCILESEIICVPSSVIMVDQLSLTTGAGYQVGAIILCGVKRYKNDVCCGEVCRA